MELRHLRYFIAVAEELNFRRAAERLHVSQPALSTQVRQLEEELEAKLLERDTHHVSMTAAGQDFLENARRILRDCEDAALSAHRICQGKAGKLSVGFVDSLGQELLPKILRAYRRQSPNVELCLQEMDTTRQIEALNGRDLDVGLIGLGLSAEISDLQLTTIAEEELVAVLPEDHELLYDDPVSLQLSALSGERFYLADREGAPLYNPWIFVLCQQAGFAPQVVEESGTPGAVLGYIAAGLGVTILPAQFGRVPTVGVRFIPLAAPAPQYRYCVAWSPKNEHLALRNFVRTAESVGLENLKLQRESVPKSTSESTFKRSDRIE